MEIKSCSRTSVPSDRLTAMLWKADESVLENASPPFVYMKSIKIRVYAADAAVSLDLRRAADVFIRFLTAASFLAFAPVCSRSPKRDMTVGLP